MFDNYAQAAHEYECAYERAYWEEDEEENLRERQEYEDWQGNIQYDIMREERG